MPAMTMTYRAMELYCVLRKPSAPSRMAVATSLPSAQQAVSLPPRGGLLRTHVISLGPASRASVWRANQKVKTNMPIAIRIMIHIARR